MTPNAHESPQRRRGVTRLGVLCGLLLFCSAHAAEVRHRIDFTYPPEIAPSCDSTEFVGGQWSEVCVYVRNCGMVADSLAFVFASTDGYGAPGSLEIPLPDCVGWWVDLRCRDGAGNTACRSPELYFPAARMNADTPSFAAPIGPSADPSTGRSVR